MKQITCGTVAFLGVFALAGCYSYASQDINNGTYNEVQANPVFATMNVGDSDQLIVRLVNSANNGTLTSYTVSNVGSGIAVHYQPGYRPLFTGDTLNPTGDKNAQEYYIVGVTPGRYTFTLTPTSVNTGISTTVTVLVQPINLGSALSSHNAVAGDTITLTAPAGLVFSQTSAVTFPTGSFVLFSRSPDSTSIKLIAGPGITGPATVTKVTQTAAPTVGALTLLTTDSLTTPALTVAPTTVSNAAPNVGVAITVTLGGNLRFLANSHVFIGGTEAGLTTVSADSSTATVTPLAFSTGTVTYTNVALSFLNSVPLALTGDKSVTVGVAYGGPTDANAGTFAGATVYTLRKSLVISDNGPMTGPCPANLGGGATCRYYKVTVPAGSTAGRIVWDGPTNTDLGVYTLNAAGTSAVTAIADDGGLASGSTGDSSAPATLTAGTIGFVVMNFGPAPVVPWFQWRIVQQ